MRYLVWNKYRKVPKKGHIYLYKNLNFRVRTTKKNQNSYSKKSWEYFFILIYSYDSLTKKYLEVKWTAVIIYYNKLKIKKKTNKGKGRAKKE